jgi:hypothetical protein
MPLSKLVRGLMASHAMQDALKIGVPLTWPKDDPRFCEGKQVEAIGKILVKAAHKHLEDRSIAYVYRESMESHDRVELGKASKADPKLQFFTGHEFVMEINWNWWKQASPEARVALVWHELRHFGVEDTDQGERLIIRSHDIEEFRDVVVNFGFWKADLAAFAKVCADQGDLFEKPKPAKR